MVAEAPDQALMAAETPGPRGAPVTPALASAAHVYLEFAGDIPRHGLYLYDAGVLPEFPGSPPPMQLAPPDGPSLPAHHGPRQQKRAAVMQWWRRLRGSDNNAIACALRVCPGHKRERGLAPKALDPSCIKAVLRCLQGPNFLGGSGRWNYSQPALDPQEHAAMAQIFDRSRYRTLVFTLFSAGICTRDNSAGSDSAGSDSSRIQIPAELSIVAPEVSDLLAGCVRGGCCRRRCCTPAQGFGAEVRVGRFRRCRRNAARRRRAGRSAAGRPWSCAVQGGARDPVWHVPGACVLDGSRNTR
eukprot:COSAG01_NODE_649_length_14487_cov_12.974624_4_plen_300_part_00